MANILLKAGLAITGAVIALVILLILFLFLAILFSPYYTMVLLFLV